MLIPLNDVAESVNKAVNAAKKNLITLPLVAETIPHGLTVKYKSSSLMLKPAKPQYVVQLTGQNTFLKIGEEIEWVGDPNTATKFDSKFAAKCRVRDLVDVPEGRVFKEIA